MCTRSVCSQRTAPVARSRAAGRGCRFVPDRDRDRRRQVDLRRRPQVALVVDLPPRARRRRRRTHAGCRPGRPRARTRPARATRVHLAVHRLLPSDLAVPAPEGDHTSRAADQHEVSGEGRVRVLDTVDLRLPLRGAVPVDGAHPAGIGRDDRATRVGAQTGWPALERARPDRARPRRGGRPCRRRAPRAPSRSTSAKTSSSCPHGVPPEISPAAASPTTCSRRLMTTGSDRAAQGGVDPDARRRAALERGAHRPQRRRVLHDRGVLVRGC